MKTGIYFCNCGTNIAEKINADEVQRAVETLPGVAYCKTVDFLCSEEGKNAMEADLRENPVDRVVIAACSPRDHEPTFRRVLLAAGMNPFLMQMVNIREQVAWVTDDPNQATSKAVTGIRAAVARVTEQVPLEKEEMEVSPSVLVIGAGPAGMKAALTLAEAGRSVTLVERSPAIGGMPVRFEELFPDMECAPCMLEPLMAEVLHGEHAERIELLTLAEVAEVKGFYGNFIARIRKNPRFVATDVCIGCGECSAVCPVSLKNEFSCGMSERKAIDFPFMGALPNAPYLVPTSCLRWQGEECRACKEACPMGEDVVDFADTEEIVEREVGAIILATGADLYDCSPLSNLGYGVLANVHTSYEFERILSSTGPTGGEIVTATGEAPRAIAIVHCAGSLDDEHCSYCSGICCQYAFKFTDLISAKLPEAKVYHFYRELALPGKGAHTLFSHARHNEHASLFRYDKLADLAISAMESGDVRITNGSQGKEKVSADFVILCPPVVPAADAGELARMLDVSRDSYGFFKELHGRLDVAQSTIRGVYLAGSCQEPMDIQRAMLQGMAAAGYALSGLAPGRKLEIEPIYAAVDEEHCAGCRLCITVCPYKAISVSPETGKAVVNAVLCHGCGTCVAACPSGAMTGHHFTNDQIMAEIREVLS